MLTEKQLRDHILTVTGLVPDVVDPNPVILGHVSLVPFGMMGHVVIFQDADGVVRTGPVPFGLSVESEAA